MRKYFLVITLLVFIRVIGQPAGQNVSNPDLPNLIPPSPSVSSLIKFEEMPVNYYTGIPSINEELVKVPMDGNLNLSIALDYHPTGVRIEEYASWVGTGWSLNGIGGFVSRTTKGAPDELGGILSNNYYNSSFVTNFNLFDQINYDSYYLGTGKYSDFDHDTMSDIFHFNFFGESGKFIFSKNSSGVIVPTLLDRKSNIKIQVIQSSQLGIDSFVLTNDTGYKFTFDIKEISTIYTNNVSLLRGGGNISVGGSTIFYPTSWHLSKVETSSGVLLCTFDYHPDIIESTKTFSYSKNDVYKHDIDIFDTNGVSPDLHNMLPFSSYTETTINVASKKVSKISITGKSEILFNVTLGRTDYENNTGCSLESIVVKDFQGNQISKFALEYQTFGTGNRLFLKELKKYGNNNNSFNPYLFLYKNPDLLPDKRSYSKDYWGYFNSYRNMEPYPAIPFLGTTGSDARTNKNVVNTGSLNKIIYPNGGYKKIDFESNTYSKTATLSKEYYDQPENKNIINESMTLNGNPNQSVSTNYKIIYIENGDFINFNLTPTFINQTWQGTANINAYRVNLTPLIPNYNFDPQNSQIIQDLSQYTFDVDQNYVDAIRPSYKLSMQDCSGQNGNSCIKTFYLKGFYLVQLGFNGDMPQMNDLVNYNISFQWHRYVENLKFNYGGGLRVK